MNRTIRFPSHFGMFPAVALLVVAPGSFAGPVFPAPDRASKPPQPASASTRSAEAVGCAGTQPPLVTDFAVYQPPSMPEPPARVPFRDPVFGTCVTRLTDRTKDIAPDDTSGGLKNEYSRVQSYNADESRILVRGTAATWYLYDAGTLQPLGKLSFEGTVDPRWDPVNPDLLYYCDGPILTKYDTRTLQPTVLHDFAPDFPGQTLSFVWTKYEGSPSIDGRLWGFMAEDDKYSIVAFLVYDQVADQILARRDTRTLPLADTVDSVSISPLGTWFVAYFDTCPAGTLGTDANPCGFMVYDRNLQGGRSLIRMIGHSDLALDAQGREVLVYQDNDTDYLSVADLATGQITPLWPIDFSYGAMGFHLSGRSFRLPGWATISTHDASLVSHTWMDDQVFAMELVPNGRVVRLAHTHSLVDPNQEHDYWAEPQASVNRDLTRILFTTNWDRSGTDQVETYVVQLPAGWSGVSGTCTVTCDAIVPGTGTVGAEVSFTGTATAIGCGGSPSYDWDFGDQTAHGSQVSVTHIYKSAGMYTWTMTASAGGTTCQKSGTISIAAAGGACSPDSATLCLLNGRFRVTADYGDYSGNPGTGHAQALTGDTGYFWFFNPSNIEVIVKMVSFCSGSSGNVAVYAGGLTDLGVTLHVTDTRNNQTTYYSNSLGTAFRLVRDGPFGCPSQVTQGDSSLEFMAVSLPAPAVESPLLVAPHPLAVCVADSQTLCLLNNRFQVRTSYTDYSNQSGAGHGVSITADTGYFWFFGASNVEAVIKMVPFCTGGSSNIGVYASGLTDVGATLTVTDTRTGLIKTYSNALGHPFDLIRDGPFVCVP